MVYLHEQKKKEKKEKRKENLNKTKGDPCLEWILNSGPCQPTYFVAYDKSHTVTLRTANHQYGARSPARLDSVPSPAVSSRFRCPASSKLICRWMCTSQST